MKTDVELVLLSAADLGVESESSLADVYKRARQVGLELCPAEVGPQLRLDYRNQPLGEVLHMANFSPSGLLLLGSDGRSEFMVPSTFRFVFALPTDGHLEAMRDPEIVSTSSE